MTYWNGGWAWMAFMPLLWIALIGLVVWAVVHLTRRPADRGGGTEHGWAPRETPEEILDRRFASGEIDADAYNEARKHLAAHRTRAR
ncbi:SHOCT domain-containing protein [Streptomyces sp. NBC_00996]|uniref:SHOCT domain-containing protein n=1 Tax=Streptomyces sp. NBC_00996 TaxID=2903710 RepID=UPI003862E11A|nr:SHOCT domain-containing protein [Streptomyces sp. NBC_00996]